MTSSKIIDTEKGGN